MATSISITNCFAKYLL